MVSCEDDRVIVDVVKGGDPSTAGTVYDVDLAAALDEIGLMPTGGYCGTRTRFNADFSAYVTVGWASDSAKHAVVVDLADGTATDLTAPRQGSGFSAGEELDETSAWFRAEPGDTAPSSTEVVVSDDVTLTLVDLADPATGTPYTGEGDRADLLASPVNYDYDQGLGGGETFISPDSKLLLNGGLGTSSYITKVGGDQDVTKAPDLPDDCSGDVHGWRDSRTAIAQEDDQLFLVDVTPDGRSSGCTAILPNDERELVGIHLSLDRSSIFVAVESSAGDDAWEWYRADLDSPGEEPAAATEEEIAGNYLDAGRSWEVFFPTQ